MKNENTWNLNIRGDRNILRIFFSFIKRHLCRVDCGAVRRGGERGWDCLAGNAVRRHV